MLWDQKSAFYSMHKSNQFLFFLRCEVTLELATTWKENMFNVSIEVEDKWKQQYLKNTYAI